MVFRAEVKENAHVQHASLRRKEQNNQPGVVPAGTLTIGVPDPSDTKDASKKYKWR